MHVKSNKTAIIKILIQFAIFLYFLMAHRNSTDSWFPIYYEWQSYTSFLFIKLAWREPKCSKHLTYTFVVIITGQERGELPDLVQLGRIVGEEGRRKRQRVARHRLQVTVFSIQIMSKIITPKMSCFKTKKIVFQ